uniref:Uncharacterized protein n=1 Tax=Chromera velia CCMP2878 TaxID=1169474 RepID=A0A0G4HPY4_9ALVE|eukprot:Cvel_7832.t1-p1 / transcript=Cvel_7832.t1 / gene=Cvel_7832 / organism=Chromera_velia_CCMP2878 / gene_product=hypothetical protein / transcript_product=hypothetical protein / location=Cvel_scaffold418:70029-71120(+) / protein_length=364 / sequence_SO=supercontig / SO=protein_coding / is_pseudo=false
MYYAYDTSTSPVLQPEYVSYPAVQSPQPQIYPHSAPTAATQPPATHALAPEVQYITRPYDQIPYFNGPSQMTTTYAADPRSITAANPRQTTGAVNEEPPPTQRFAPTFDENGKQRPWTGIGPYGDISPRWVAKKKTPWGWQLDTPGAAHNEWVPVYDPPPPGDPNTVPPNNSGPALWEKAYFFGRVKEDRLLGKRFEVDLIENPPAPIVHKVFSRGARREPEISKWQTWLNKISCGMTRLPPQGLTAADLERMNQKELEERRKNAQAERERERQEVAEAAQYGRRMSGGAFRFVPPVQPDPQGAFSEVSEHTEAQTETGYRAQPTPQPTPLPTPSQSLAPSSIRAPKNTFGEPRSAGASEYGDW